MLSEEQGKSGFTIRAVIISVLLTVFLLATSMYIALKIGALPWPIIFSVIASGAILKLLSRFFKKTNIHEINVAQAGGTIGGLLASGVVFTIPGIIYLQQQGINVSLPNPLALALVCIFGGVLGVLLSVPTRRVFVEEEKLPYPSGTAGAEVLKASEKIGKNTMYIVLALTLTGIFVLLRNLYFPGGFPISLNPSLGLEILLYPMPLAIAIGYILGHKASVNSWFLGSVIGWLVMIPVMVLMYGIDTATGGGIVKDLGMGIVLGAGIGFFVSYIIPRAKRIFLPMFRLKGPWYAKAAVPFSLLTIIALYIAGIPFLASIIAVAGTWVMVTVASMMTGETNIDPLEQFGIMIGLLSLGIFAILSMPLGYLPAFLIVAFVSIASAIAGDIGHDYKSAKLVGTKAKDIIKVDMIAVVFAGLLAPLILSVITSAFGQDFFTPNMPAPQAQLVAGSIFGFANPEVFYAGFAIAFIWVVIEMATKKKFPILPMVFGIGMFLGPTLGILLAIGGIIRYWSDKKSASLYSIGLVIAAGIMGGEGIAGFGSGALYIAGLSSANAAWSMMCVFVPAFLIALFFWRRGIGNDSSRS